MIVEQFKNGDPAPVYKRFEERGRMTPEGLRYLTSWVDIELQRCFQLMETEEPGSLDQWVANWNDLVDFEIYQVISSQQAAEMVSSRQSTAEARTQ